MRFPPTQAQPPCSVSEVRGGLQREGGVNRGKTQLPGILSASGAPCPGPAGMATLILTAGRGRPLPAVAPPALLPLSQTRGLQKGQDAPWTQSIDRSNSREEKTRAGKNALRV